MGERPYSLQSTLLTTLTSFKRPDVPLPVALRNTAAVTLPLAAGVATNHVATGLGISVGALVVMFADQPGPYRQRLQLIAMVCVAAALSGLAGFLTGGHPYALLGAYALWGFGGGLLVLFGPRMTRVGMTSMILLVVAAATPLPWRQACGAGALILAGGALQLVFSVAAWPLRRYRPERLALAVVYRDLARLARRQPLPDDAPPVTDTMTQLQQTLLGRSILRSRAMEAFHTLLVLAERIRLELMGLTETGFAHAAQQPELPDAIAEVLERIAMALEKAEPPARAQQALAALEALDTAQVTSLHADSAHAQMHALTGQIAAAVRNSNWAGSQGEIRARQADTAMPRALRNASPLAALRANLRLSSVAFRHAVRMAVVLVVAGLVAHHLGLGHAYWLPMTVAIVLRPDFGSTFRIGMLRMLGTILGLLLTTFLLWLTPNNLWAHLTLMAVLCFGFRYLATAHYGIAVAALTGTVVILLSFEGVAPASAADDRVIQTVIGCALALLAYRAWPTWERGRVRHAMAAMLDSYAAYLRALTEPDDSNLRQETRTAARAARSNAQASLERLRGEPASSRELTELATSVFASANRLVRTAMAMEALLDNGDGLPGAQAAHAFVQRAGQMLDALAHCVREHRAPDDLPSLRMGQQLLAAQLRAKPDSPRAELMITLSDRLTANLAALAHVSERQSPRPSHR